MSSYGPFLFHPSIRDTEGYEARTIPRNSSERAKYLTHYIYFCFDAPAALDYITHVIRKQVSIDHS